MEFQGSRRNPYESLAANSHALATLPHGTIKNTQMNVLNLAKVPHACTH